MKHLNFADVMQSDGEIKLGRSSPQPSFPSLCSSLAESGPGGRILCFLDTIILAGDSMRASKLKSKKPAIILFLKDSLFLVLFKTK